LNDSEEWFSFKNQQPRIDNNGSEVP